MTTTSSASDSGSRSDWSPRRWVVGVFLLAVLGAVLWTVINPYRGQRYEEVPHGDHVHYRPKDWNEDVPISRVPTRPPEPGERITPDGEIVPDREE
jgi:hypothetical protein